MDAAAENESVMLRKAGHQGTDGGHSVPIPILLAITRIIANMQSAL
jgi:hypothetical protein